MAAEPPNSRVVPMSSVRQIEGQANGEGQMKSPRLLFSKHVWRRIVPTGHVSRSPAGARGAKGNVPAGRH